jgi:hypothetical protein
VASSGAGVREQKVARHQQRDARDIGDPIGHVRRRVAGDRDVALDGRGRGRPRVPVKVHQPVVADPRDQLRGTAGSDPATVGEHDHARFGAGDVGGIARERASDRLAAPAVDHEVELERRGRAALAPRVSQHSMQPWAVMLGDAGRTATTRDRPERSHRHRFTAARDSANSPWLAA